MSSLQIHYKVVDSTRCYIYLPLKLQIHYKVVDSTRCYIYLPLKLIDSWCSRLCYNYNDICFHLCNFDYCFNHNANFPFQILLKLSQDSHTSQHIFQKIQRLSIQQSLLNQKANQYIRITSIQQDFYSLTRFSNHRWSINISIIEILEDKMQTTITYLHKNIFVFFSFY